MLTTIILAAALQASGPVEAECALTAHGMTRRNGLPTSLSVDCPDDVTDREYLQQVADYAVGLIPLDFSGNAWPEIATSVWFEWTPESSWRPIPGQPVFRVSLRISPRLVERGRRHQTCSYAFWPDERGVPANAEIACSVDGRAISGGRRYVDGPMMVAIENARFLPVDTPYCFQDIIHVSASVNGAPPPPVDLPELPLLCEQEE